MSKIFPITAAMYRGQLVCRECIHAAEATMTGRFFRASEVEGKSCERCRKIFEAEDS